MEASYSVPVKLTRTAAHQREPSHVSRSLDAAIVPMMNRIGRRVIMGMLLIVALALVWNVLGGL